MKRNLISFVSYCAKPQAWLRADSRSENHMISSIRNSINNFSILGTPAATMAAETTVVQASQAGKDYSKKVREGWDD